MTLRWTKIFIMNVSGKINFMGVELCGPITNTTSTITRSSKLILHTPIWWIIVTVFIWITHVWIITNMIWHKIATIKPIIIFMGGKVGGPSTHTKFAIFICNTKLITTSIIKWIFPNPWLCHKVLYAMTLIWPKHPIVHLSTKIKFLGGEVSCHRINNTYTITSSTTFFITFMRWYISLSGLHVPISWSILVCGVTNSDYGLKDP